MARFRATIQGTRGMASRLGSIQSGMHANIASWEGAVRVELYHRDGHDYARIKLVPHQGKGVNAVLFDGRIDGTNLKGALDMCALIARHTPENEHGIEVT